MTFEWVATRGLHEFDQQEFAVQIDSPVEQKSVEFLAKPPRTPPSNPKNRVREKAKLASPIKLIWVVQSSHEKIFLFSFFQKYAFFFLSRLIEEGRIAIVTNVERGMRTRRCRAREGGSQGEAIRERWATCETSGIDAYGEVVWSWHPLLVPSPAEVLAAQPGAREAIQSGGRRWQKEFVAGEITYNP